MIVLTTYPKAEPSHDVPGEQADQICETAFEGSFYTRGCSATVQMSLPVSIIFSNLNLILVKHDTSKECKGVIAAFLCCYIIMVLSMI